MRAAAEHALALLPGGPEHLERRIALMQVASRARRFSGDPAGAFELARAALELVTKIPDTRAAALAYDWFAGGSMTRGDDATATVWAEKAQKVAAALGDFGIEASALTTLATCMSDRRPRETLHLLDRAAAMARRAGAADVLARVHQNGIVVSFSAEAERQRFVRIERALAFSERYRFGRDAEQCHRAVAFQEREVSVEVVPGGDGVENEIETFRARVHRIFIFGNDHLMRSEAFCVRSFAG